MQLKVRQVCEKPCWIPKSKRILGSEWLEEEVPAILPIAGIEQRKINNHNSIFSNIMKSNVYRQTLKDQEGNSLIGDESMATLAELNDQI